MSTYHADLVGAKPAAPLAIADTTRTTAAAGVQLENLLAVLKLVGRKHSSANALTSTSQHDDVKIMQFSCHQYQHVVYA